MGFFSSDLPVVDMDAWRATARSDRLRLMARHIAERGTGNPDVLYVVYAIKIVLYILIGMGFALATEGIDGWTDVATWWSEPIVFQKVVLWTLLFEVLGLGCGFGPLAGRVAPPMGSPLYWLRTGTVRLPPWPMRIPSTAGDRRSPVDVALYAALLVATVVALLSDGTGPLSAPATSVGLIPTWKIAIVVGVLAAMGLRDKVVFLAARGEVYGTLTVAFLLPGLDMIVAAKVVMVAIWMGAATSKLNRHFPFVISTMMANNPLIRSKWLKRKLFRDYPDDLRPSWIAALLAHVGTVIELCVPLVLFFSGGGIITQIAALLLVALHLIILTSVPLGVPLEWNVFMIYGIGAIFLAHSDAGLGDVTQPWFIAAFVVVLVTTVAIGHVWPRKVSFLPGMRYYAGNWDTSVWLFTESASQKIADQRVGLGLLQHKYFEKLFGSKEKAELPLHMGYAFRSMFAHGRAVMTLLDRAVPAGRELDYTAVEGETVAAYALGWAFGDGHLHHEQLAAALHSRCKFEPGEVRIVMLDGQPMHRQRQEYRLVDAATGEFESGTFKVADCVSRQPWQNDVPLQIREGNL
ncbi:DUF3556 domain-containing protein [Mycolicibacterium setense]|uniref:DUF3556 domain-containing protein n=1 Tax=Mycolicibacterium setense TaxID=431269 RepID=UPI00057403ED|nr:DUF3556 domain-containing protein [Mycolicibacterium setense]KHO22081.1 membrane protein [Mycolicibacterium setense]MCV7113683.1 DUF3556 domain-containing protein [Mycolicibacterium setense]